MEYLRLCKSSELTSQPAISHVFSFRVRTTGPAGQRWMGCIVPPTAAPTVPAHRALSAQPIHRIVERLSSAARPRQVHSQPQALAPSSISMTSHATSPVILKRVQYTYPITHPPLQQPQPDKTPQPPIQCRAAAAAALCLCEGVKPTHGIGLARLRRELLQRYARGAPRGSGSDASSRRGAPLVPCVARRTRSVWDSVVGIQFCDACVLSRGP